MKRALVLLVGLSLAGCSLAPRYQQPQLPTPASWPAGDPYLMQSEAELPKVGWTFDDFEATAKKATTGGKYGFGIGMGDIARCMDIHQSTASNLIKTLLRRELISSAKAPEDRRNVRLHILPEGMAVLGQVSGPFEGVLPAALGKLPVATLRRLDQDLGELIALLKADEQAGGIPLAEL